MIGWLAPLVITLVDSIWTGLTKHRLAVNRVGVEFALSFGGFFSFSRSSRPLATTSTVTGARKSVLSPGILA